MIFVLLLLIIEGGTAIAIFVRCFADKKGLEEELKGRLYIEFPRAVLATISVLLFLLTTYCSAAMGQLFFFHVVLIRKGMRTYDYIMAMKEENQPMDLFNDSDSSSDESTLFDSPEKPTFVSQFICRGRKLNQVHILTSSLAIALSEKTHYHGHFIKFQSPTRLSIRIDGDPESSTRTKKDGFLVSIDPWKLIKMSRDKAILASEKARERLKKQKPENDQLKSLPFETKRGPLINAQNKMDNTVSGSAPHINKGRIPGSPGRFSSPRRRFSGSPTMFSSILPSPKQKYRSSFDLKLTDVSKELETYISRQVLYSVIRKDGSEASPR